MSKVVSETSKDGLDLPPNLFAPRRYSIIDVFLINQPLTTTTNVQTAPGVSDHEILIVHNYLSINR